MKNQLTHVAENVLVQSALSGNRNAFDEIVRRYCQPMIEFASARAATLEDAEDAVQETFLRAYQHLDSFDKSYPLKNWLFTIAYRQLISSYRKKKTDRLSELVIEQLPSSETEKSPVGYDWLWDAVRNMGPDIFTSLWLKYKQEMSIADISKVMKKSETSIRVLLHRARKRLAKEIAERPQETTEQINWNLKRMTCLERTK